MLIVTVFVSTVTTRPIQAESLGSNQTAAADDGQDPQVQLTVDSGYPADPTLAGGSYSTVTASFSVDDPHLAGYVLTFNGSTIQQEQNLSQTSISSSVPINVASPDKLASGVYSVALEATDTSGRTSHTEATLTVDTTAPTVSVTGGNILVQNGSVSPSVMATDSHGIGGYLWTANMNNPSVLDYVASAAEPTFTPDSQGSYTFNLATADGLGNIDTQSFTFDYATQLAPLPALTSDDPTAGLTSQVSAGVTLTSSDAKPTIRSSVQDQTTTGTTTDSIGSTISTARTTTPTRLTTTITATNSGWSILGILWYWWVIMAAAVVGTWQFLKRRAGAPFAETVAGDL